MKYFFNGFLIDTLHLAVDCKIKEYTYRGVDRYCWPYLKKEYLDNEIDRLEYRFEQTQNTVAVSNDINFIDSYIRECENSGIEIRLLLCATEMQYPEVKINKEYLKKYCDFLGYDHAYPCGDYFSVILNDLGRFKEFECFKLNKNGLFDSYDEFEQFVGLRTKLKQEIPMNLRAAS